MERELAIHRELDGKRLVRLKSHKNLMSIGAVFVVIGIFSIMSPIIESLLHYPIVNASCLTPFFLIGGLVALIKGCLGCREERRKV
jgi:uncharacterized membrane protein